MKRIMSTAFVIFSVCFGLLTLTPIFAVSGGPEVQPEGIPDRMDALSAAAEMEKGNKTVSGVAGGNQPVRSANPVTIFPESYAESGMGYNCVTPYMTCPVNPPQPLNYPCCCPDGSCGYVIP